jgi:hypothetical protein
MAVRSPRTRAVEAPALRAPASRFALAAANVRLA